MQRPHVVLIHCHDIGNWLSCYDAPNAPTPRLQALADDGIVFDAAFATAPLCTPARGSLFTGLSPHRHGLQGLAHHGWRYSDGVRTLPEMMRAQGYHTALIGLQHEDPDPCVLGFDEVQGLGFLPRALQVGDEAVNWFAENGRSESPYLVTIGTWEAHRPWPVEDYEPAALDAVDVPPYLPDNEYTRADVAGMYGSIRQVDTAVGMVLDAIDEHGDPENTLVLFTTDHGAAFPRAKGTLYDPGVRVAMIARPPASWGVPPGRVGTLVSHLDVVPTALDLAGGGSERATGTIADAQPGGLEGRSLVPELHGGTSAATERVLYLQKTYHDRYDPIRALRTDRFKYIRNFEPGAAMQLSKDLEESLTWKGMGDDDLAPCPAEELYILDTDPWERHNAAGDPSWAQVRAELAEELERRMNDLQDPLSHGPVAEPPAPRRRTA